MTRLTDDTTPRGLMMFFVRQTVTRMQNGRDVKASARLAFSFAAKALDERQVLAFPAGRTVPLCPLCDAYDIPGHKEAAHP